jgi:hypothetical protein
MPAVEIFIKGIVFFSLLIGFLYLASSGNVVSKPMNVGLEGTSANYEVAGIKREFEYTEDEKYMIAYYIFGIFWSLEFCNALGTFAISYAVVGWYFAKIPKQISCLGGGLWMGYVWGSTVHMGTLAVGSFLIAVLRFARFICFIIEKQAKSEGNKVVECLMKILECIITCFEKFLKWCNKNAYIDVAITSKWFCSAAFDVMEFIAKNGPTIALLNGACTLFTYAGLMLISVSTSLISYYLIVSNERWTDETSEHHVSSPGAVCGLVFIGSLFIAYAFMQIFDHTADTLLYTFCYNKSKAHNTVANYCPHSLLKLTEYKKLEPPKKEKAPEQKQGFFASLFGSKK